MIISLNLKTKKLKPQEMIADGLKVDIWSCGIILFAMLFVYLPFEDKNTGDLYKKILAGNYEIPDFYLLKHKIF